MSPRPAGPGMREPLRRATRRLDAGIEFLARALLAETAGADLRGIEALAACSVNRWAAARRTTPEISLAAMVRNDCLFPAGIRSPRPEEAAAFAACRRIAARAVAGVLADPTRGATRWHRAGTIPRWAAGLGTRHAVADWVFYA